MCEIFQGGIVNELCKPTDGSIEKIELLEAEMRKHETIQLQTSHRFALGLYARELFIPKGVLVTGKIHKFEQINIISQGSVVALTDEGKVQFDAPYSFVSMPGAKRAVYALEDTVWTTIIATDATADCDLEELERAMVCDSFEDYKQHLISKVEKLEVQHVVL